MEKTDRILVTGSNGFLGKALLSKLRGRGYTNLVLFTKEEYDIVKEAEVDRLFKEKGPFDVVIHLAAVIGGIGFNKRNPGLSFYGNLMMNTLMQEYSRINKVKKFVGIGSVCEYPKFTEVPFKEKNLWDGYPEETNAPYGLSKKMMLVQSQAYREQYGFNGIHLLQVNLYGPWDNFSLNDSHVIAALILKFHNAKEKNLNEVTLWGTGSASREFLYVEDAAEAIVLAMERYDKSEPVNIGASRELTIKEVAEIISKNIGFKGKIIWDTSKPDGQPRRCLDTSKAKEEFGFTAKTSFEEGIKKTVEWYESQKKKGL